MTIPATKSRNDYVGNGATSVYSYNFRIFSATDLLVTRRDLQGAETSLVYPTDYTVSGVGSPSGGSITLVAGALSSGYVLTIRRYVELTQETDIRNQGAFYPETHEDTFDYLTMIDLQQQDELDRSLKFSETDPSNGNIPGSFDRAGKFLAFDQDGSPIASAGVSEVPVSSFMATVLDDPTAAAARASLGFSGAGGTVATDNIEALSVTSAKLAANSVDTSKMVDSSVTLAKLASTVIDLLVPVGSIQAYAGSSAPSGYLLCDGSAVSRSTYSGLFAVLGSAWGSGDGSTTFNLPDARGQFLRGLMSVANVTGSGTASSNNATFTSHGYKRTGTKVRLSSGTLSGLSTSADYYAIVIDSNTLAFATSKANALAGTKIAITGSNSAVISQWEDPDASSRTASNSGGNSGANIGSIQTDQFKSHTHDYVAGISTGTTTSVSRDGGTSQSSGNTAILNTGGNETRPSNIAVNYIIKT